VTNKKQGWEIANYEEGTSNHKWLVIMIIAQKCGESVNEDEGMKDKKWDLVVVKEKELEKENSLKKIE